MRNSPTFKDQLICESCGVTTTKTGPVQKYCPDCARIKDKERKIKHYIKTNPNAYNTKITPPKCSVCNEPFSSHYEGIGYCNKHYLRMYNNGSLEPKKHKTNVFVIDGEFVTMYTNKGQPFSFDLINLDRVAKHSWCYSKTGYLVANVNNKVTKLHRFILQLTNPKIAVDHINGDPSDNRICNLRVCDNSDNAKNTKISRNNTSGYHGVTSRPSGRYRARIMVNRKEIHLGTYDTFEEAKSARIKAELRYFGEFAPSKGALQE